jgi:hypothetical protein
MNARKHTLIALLAVLAGVMVALLPNAAANAAAYRYWGYYQLTDGQWSFAQKGPDQTTPADGSVEGWRFAVADESSSRMPRATPTFDDLCSSTKAQEGKKRVGLVIDYGRKADSADGTEPPEPVGKCAVVDTAATGQEVLASVAELRVENKLVCGIDGYPASGCGDEVTTVTPEAQAADQPVDIALPGDKAATSDSAAKEDDDDSDVGTWVGIGVAVLAVAGLALVALRRRGTSA